MDMPSTLGSSPGFRRHWDIPVDARTEMRSWEAFRDLWSKTPALERFGTLMHEGRESLFDWEKGVWVIWSEGFTDGGITDSGGSSSDGGKNVL